MEFDGWLTIGTIGGVLVMLARSRVNADTALLGGLGVLILLGVVPAGQAFAGFGNEGLATVAVLFVVATGLRETGVSTVFVQRLLGQTTRVMPAQVRTMLPTGVLSAFLNNTPVVALLMPVIHDWARRNQVPASKLLIPLSYASILGGMCTLVGTSTNLIINGMILDAGMQSTSMFTITMLGLPCALLGLVYLTVVGRRLLPDRRSAASSLADAREYTLEMVVEPGGAVDGKTIEEAGLRRLEGAFLAEVSRNGDILTAVRRNQRLLGNDQLVFVGVVESMVDLNRFPGLQPATNQVFKLDSPRRDRVLVEAVVSNLCPLIGRSIRDGRFRSFYDAVVIGVSRNGERVESRIGDIVLQPGDTLLLEAHQSFMDSRRDSRDFYLVSRVDDLRPPRYEKRWVSVGILGLMVGTVAAGLLTMFQGALVAAMLMIATKCCSEAAARRSIDWRLLVAIGAALGLGKAMLVSGAAGAIADLIIGLAGSHPFWVLFAVYGVTMLFTELVTNNAAAVLVFPIAQASAAAMQVDPMPFYMVLMVAASASFITPIGYQTNLMVYGPGGYRFTDFTRIGLPLSLMIWVVATLLAPMIWPF